MAEQDAGRLAGGAAIVEPGAEGGEQDRPLAGRDLADSGRENLTVVAAVTRMRRAFGPVTEVVSATEQVVNEMTGKLDSLAAELSRVTPLAASLADEALTGNLAAAQSKLSRLRATLSSDPLSLWQGGPDPAAGAVDTSGADRLAINHQFTRSYIKQQIDYVRALGDERVLAQPPRTQQLLGWYTRVVSSLDEYYQPAEKRLYRSGQG